MAEYRKSRHHRIHTIGKRLLSAGLVVGMMVSLFQASPAKDEVYAEQSGGNAKKTTEMTAEKTVDGKIYRGVVDALTDLPQYGVENYTDIERGSAKRPFVILEIVPYEEYAEIGYLISGCEPIPAENMNGSKVMGTLASLNSCDVQAETAYFFADEPEGKEDLYDADLCGWIDQNTKAECNGYYEYVGDGNGNFTRESVLVKANENEKSRTAADEPAADGENGADQNTEENTENDDVESEDAVIDEPEEIDEEVTEEPDETVEEETDETEEPGETEELPNPDTEETDDNLDDTETADEETVVFVPDESGDYIWHTVNAFETLEEETDFDDPLDKATPEVGDRIYTKRSVSESDKVLCIQPYYIYTNRDYFLRDTLQLSENEIADYGIVVKTITPEELNQNQEWIDYADLIDISPKEHVGGLKEIWKQYNRLGKKSKVTEYDSHAFAKNDFSWETTVKIFEKVTAEKNFAGLVMDDNIYNEGQNGCVITDSNKKTVQPNMFDWNMKSMDKKYESSLTGCKNNMYKLVVMLMAMDTNLFEKLYLDGDDPIVTGGMNTLQKNVGNSDAAEYWTVEAFYLFNTDVDLSAYGNSWGQYWNSKDAWNSYTAGAGISNTVKKDWVSDHVYTYPGNRNMLQDYLLSDMNNGQQGAGISSGNSGSWFTDFYDYVDASGDAGKADSSDAIRYILGINKKTDTTAEVSTLRILDIEPSVGLNSDSTPEYFLTDSYVRMLIPSFTGDIEITNQTTAEFIGKTEDLNSTYNLIFMGLDCSAYNTVSRGIQLNSGTWVSMVVPDWNDNSMDGKIYFHTGDKMESTESGRSARSSVKFLWSTATNTALTGTTLRFSGDDITKKKLADLQSFVAAGYPVVAVRYLYDLEKALVDENTYVYQFIAQEKEKESGGVYSTLDTAGIAASLKNVEQAVVFTETPKLYNGETATDTSAVIANPNYLSASGGKAYMPFRFTVSEAGYSYQIYVDQDKNGDFSDEEIIFTSPATVGENYYSYRVASSLVGLVQWKIEVYKDSNPNIRYMETGCSAVKNNGTKKEIKVLQIMPKEDSASYDGKLNLETNSLFKNYYENLEDYDVSVTSISLDTFESYFTGKGFSYDMSKEIEKDVNPVNVDALGGDLAKYNMIIVGFGDTYGGRDLSNKDGAADYLLYYTALGKSILYTHDLTSMYNTTNSSTGKYSFGATANALFRDVMGMNRYKAVTSQLPGLFTSYGSTAANGWSHLNSLIAYQNADAESYDWIDSQATHGFTYYAMKRMGWASYTENVNKNNKVPYRYMITNPEGNAVCTKTYVTSGTGFNNNNDLTTKAAKLNEGQITTYPYKIADSLTIAATHGQWYQLNVEDDDVTVWYTLADNVGDSAALSTGAARAWNQTDNNGAGTALTYGVSPNDAANNYYIYSKGNIFYSGVGHSTVSGDMEAKLFVNTMIAAYRASKEPPVIEITNDDASLDGYQNYSISILQEYDSKEYAPSETVSNDNEQIAEEFNVSDSYTVKFQPVDFNVVTTTLECHIWFEDSNDAAYFETGAEDMADTLTIHSLSDGSTLTAQKVKEVKKKRVVIDGVEKEVTYDVYYYSVTGLKNGLQYSIDYPLKYMSNDPAVRTICFEIKNNVSEESSTTILNMKSQPLFQLD
jgi:hypothetical protein